MHYGSRVFLGLRQSGNGPQGRIADLAGHGTEPDRCHGRESSRRWLTGLHRDPHPGRPLDAKIFSRKARSVAAVTFLGLFGCALGGDQPSAGVQLQTRAMVDLSSVWNLSCVAEGAKSASGRVVFGGPGEISVEGKSFGDAQCASPASTLSLTMSYGIEKSRYVHRPWPGQPGRQKLEADPLGRTHRHGVQRGFQVRITGRPTWPPTSAAVSAGQSGTSPTATGGSIFIRSRASPDRAVCAWATPRGWAMDPRRRADPPRFLPGLSFESRHSG